MTQKIAIIGAGVLGSAIAWRLGRAGARVTLIDPEPGKGASAASLAWLNASFASDPVYNALRRDSVALWQELQTSHPDLPVRFPGAILFSDRDEDLAALTSPDPGRDETNRPLIQGDVRNIEPALATPPEQAVHCPQDGYGEPAGLCAWFLEQATSHGVTLQRSRATGFDIAEGRVTGVAIEADTETAIVPADTVILAAGIDLPGLLEHLGLTVHMANQPGLSMRTAPLDRRIGHILSTPHGDLWQGPDGRILIASSAGDGETTEQAANRALRALDAMFGTDTTPETVTARDRPIPADGRPAVGPLGPAGLYVVSMHSGMTLAPVMAEMVAREVLDKTPDPRLAPYRPDRAVLQGGP